MPTFFQKMEQETLRRVGNMGFNLQGYAPTIVPPVMNWQEIEEVDGKDDPWDWEEE